VRGPRVTLAAAGVVALGPLALSGCEDSGGELAAAVDMVAPVVAGEAGLEAYLDCLSSEGVTLVDAHRGGPAPGHPENAIATFARTLSLAPATLEVDVGVTADGVLVLMHDDTLDRTTTCEGELAAQDWADLAECRLVDNDGRTTSFAIPTLEEALAWADGKTILRLDVKQSVAYEDVVDAVRAAGAEERVAVITYNVGGAARLARLAPELVVNATVSGLAELEELHERGVEVEQIVAWTGTSSVDDRLNAALDARDVPVIFGTLGGGQSVDREIVRSGDEGRYAEIAAQGVDIIATDRPAEAYLALSAERDPTLAIAACRTAS
jgi:glycerophosphoryl diester phosphodiesterase